MSSKAATHAWPVAINGMAGQSRPERKEWMQRASAEAFLHDPRIIRKQGEKKMNNRIMGVHKEVTEMEEEEENLTCAWK
jgi:hypothetical protein